MKTQDYMLKLSWTEILLKNVLKIKDVRIHQATDDQSSEDHVTKVLKKRSSEERFQRIAFRRSKSERNVGIQPSFAEVQIGWVKRTSGKQSQVDREKLKADWQTTYYGTIKEIVATHPQHSAIRQRYSTQV